MMGRNPLADMRSELKQAAVACFRQTGYAWPHIGTRREWISQS